MKLQTQDAFKFGQKNVIPFLGKVQIDSKGFIEVPSQEIGDQIIAAEIGFNWPSTTTATTDETTVDETTVTSTEATTTTETTAKEATTTGVGTTTDESQVGAEAATVTDETVTAATGATDSNTDLAAAEKQQLLDSIDEMVVNDLKDLAKPFPSKEWSSLNKADLQKYLKEKLA